MLLESEFSVPRSVTVRVAKLLHVLVSNTPFLSTTVSGLRRRSTASAVTAGVEGLLSLAAFWGVSDSASFVIPGSEPHHPLHSAMRSGACFALVTPFMMLLARGVELTPGNSKRHLRLGFSVPRGFDKHAVFDLYLMGLAAGVLGAIVPGLEILGHWMGTLLVNTFVLWRILVVVVVVPGMYFAVGACVNALSPAEGFVVHTRPRRGMWGLCAVGHAVITLSCFYSPDVHGRTGYALGFVHIARLLKLVFSFPATLEDGVSIVSTDVADN